MNANEKIMVRPQRVCKFLTSGYCFKVIGSKLSKFVSRRTNDMSSVVPKLFGSVFQLSSSEFLRSTSEGVDDSYEKSSHKGLRES